MTNEFNNWLRSALPGTTLIETDTAVVVTDAPDGEVPDFIREMLEIKKFARVYDSMADDTPEKRDAYKQLEKMLDDWHARNNVCADEFPDEMDDEPTF